MFPCQRIIYFIGKEISNNSLPFLQRNALRKYSLLSTNVALQQKTRDSILNPIYFVSTPQRTNFYAFNNVTPNISTNHNLMATKNYSSSNDVPQTTAQKLRKAVAEYGSVVIIFHVGISLISLGVCYTLVSSGLDLTGILSYLGLNADTENKLATNAGAFVVAYAVHKVFAPARIGVTLTATPFIVRYLRKVGWLKVVPKKIN